MEYNLFPWFSYREKIKRVVINDGVTSIAARAFSRCTGLTSITIPDSVTSIGYEAFYYCTGLTSITIPDSVTSIGSGAFDDTAYYNNADNWSDGMLYINNHLIKANPETIANIPIIRNETKCIAGGAFYYCTGLTSITIPDGVTNIGEGAFFSCSGLKSVEIPDSVKSIDRSAFYGCTGLRDVYYSGTEDEWNAIDIGDNNDALTSARIHYNSTGPVQQKATITKTDTADAWQFDVSVQEIYGNSYVYAATYDAEGRLLGIERVPLDETGNTRVSVGRSGSDSTEKVFVWTNGVQPITYVEQFE